MQKPIKIVLIFVFLLMFITACSNDKETDQSSDSKEKVELTISAAASLKDAMAEIQDTYRQEHPEVTLRFNFAGSGSLMQQISKGAPVDLFFSAAEDKFDRLVEEGKIEKEDGVDLLGNSLVLVVPDEEESVSSFDDLTNTNINKMAIGTPESVPAGKYAKESLKKLGIWKDVESKMVYAKDVRQVLSYVETGNVAAGMVYKTDAVLSDKVKITATAEPETHTPIIYPVGIVKNTEHYDAAKDFYQYLQRDQALKVFEKYGFNIE
ncbi:molybdate ABC transporter substrate-binding protein [Virgibacillus dakarensis]|uniref:ABC transporter substrate-binding lipoprotein YvgL n=1 Tax=Lentibacillus populi TaxID=1827502 RepID=A0A9W5X707_9BACI|nr:MULTISPECIES: molybdate ABC transporter substrate-binding protein [Bacillaceae]MBT2215542.1 molybdate ABC transporter substrate-binding protein [Virgibacillus dakarensis]MTW86024.1 molybdate ABC transporter substrate-binding protein [Virgibacillus dakarensis]GGB56392.1 putative ABC transporter substrate-binding lipoprotein YvgL [Lentibacillus populi]